MKTLSGPARVEIEIKRSRFIAHAQRVDSLADTLEFYESVASADANHNCWAWKLDNQYRFNDDGEPASTAGKPILAAIDGKGVDHVMVIVTRYFGGTKLGVGGLVRAYGGSAARCIDQAGIENILPKSELDIEAGFSWTGQVYAALDACKADKLDEKFSAGGIRIRVEVLESEKARLESLLRDMTRGSARVMPVE